MCVNLSIHHNMTINSLISIEQSGFISIFAKNVLSFFTDWHKYCILNLCR